MYNIGDWVNIIPEETEEPVYGQIKELVGTQYWIYGDIYGDTHIAPIPLTDEILRDNGFKKEVVADWGFEEWEKEDGLFRLYTFTDQDILGFVWNDLNIRYVHELQQLMRLVVMCQHEMDDKERDRMMNDINNMKMRELWNNLV